jgi:hypothetical protein
VRREDLRLLFDRARELCGHVDYVVMGRLAVLGQGGEVPARMAASIDVDAYCRDDPARTLAPTGRRDAGGCPGAPPPSA